ncbi:BEL1-like homeodomain protein 1 [Gossypium australe]|uniref:BEL1-like homeodomain protein 1 n=1 Tax=Gossypium australe TaxID=47621 RepID=A0A5B6X6Z5_9ROSI|nr:BEL1-like homeodomain protein 1 [Gossypium australe]
MNSLKRSLQIVQSIYEEESVFSVYNKKKEDDLQLQRVGSLILKWNIIKLDELRRFSPEC